MKPYLSSCTLVLYCNANSHYVYNTHTVISTYWITRLNKSMKTSVYFNIYFQYIHNSDTEFVRFCFFSFDAAIHIYTIIRLKGALTCCLAHILSNSRSFDIFLYHVLTSPNIKWVDRATTKNAVPLENFSYVFYTEAGRW